MKKIFTILALSATLFISAQSKKELKIINKASAEITMKSDKFEGSVKWNSPYFGTGIAATTEKRVAFVKVKSKNGDITNYLSLTTYGSTLNVAEKGLILLFQDGSRIEKPDAEIDTKNDTGSPYWKYTAFVRITDEELEMFATKKVDAFKLYIYEGKPITKKAVLQVMGYARGMQKVGR